MPACLRLKTENWKKQQNIFYLRVQEYKRKQEKNEEKRSIEYCKLKI